jgi:hypothetical protein|tara:strand:+ start:1455 stop:1793 length:339 start_codon:yes stop_codon:yes gene_type:complete
MVNNNYFTKNLNTVLNESHYPHLKNKLFDDLILPHGLIKNSPNNIKCTNIKICYTDECIDKKVFDKLVELVEVKPDKSNSLEKFNNKPNNKAKITRKKGNTKRDKKTRRKKK